MNDTQKILKISDEFKNKKLIIIDEDFIKNKWIINGVSKIDLMGGKKSLFNGFVNVDKIAEEGIKTHLEYLDKVIKNNSCKEIMVNNPYGVNGITILEIANHLLVQDGKIMMSGTLNNKYFKVLMKKSHEEKILDLGFYLKKDQLDKRLKNKEFRQTSGEIISNDKMMTFYAIKNKTPSIAKNQKEVKNGKIPERR